MSACASVSDHALGYSLKPNTAHQHKKLQKEVAPAADAQLSRTSPRRSQANKFGKLIHEGRLPLSEAGSDMFML
jgi:hypothetical protein